MKLVVACCLALFGSSAATGASTSTVELSVGLLEQGILIPAKSAPPGTFIEGSEEKGTRAAAFLWRGKPWREGLGMRPTAKLHLNLDGRTSFASVGGEWRQEVLGGRFYAQAGMGLAVHDGYRFTPDPFAAGLTEAEALDRHEVYRNRTAFGSRILFNPNLSLGVRLSSRAAVEGVFEHYSHKQLFNTQNPGINLLGVRLVRAMGPTR